MIPKIYTKSVYSKLEGCDELVNKPVVYRNTIRKKRTTISEEKIKRLAENNDIQNIETIGQNIRKYRVEKKLRQEGLAEKCGLSSNYIGLLERGEKTPSLESFIRILNALEISADLVLVDVLSTGYKVKQSLLEEKLEQVSPEEREKIFDVIDAMLKHIK